MHHKLLRYILKTESIKIVKNMNLIIMLNEILANAYVHEIYLEIVSVSVVQ